LPKKSKKILGCHSQPRGPSYHLQKCQVEQTSSRLACRPESIDLNRAALCCGPLLSRFLGALFQFSKRGAGEATEFSRSRVELLRVMGAARLECGEPAAEAGELIRRQLSNGFGDFFNFHVAQYSTAERRSAV